MDKILIGLTALLLVSTAASAQRAAVDITNAQIQEVLKKGTGIDHTLRVVDMGDYQLSVAVIHRGPTAAPAAAGGGRAPAPATNVVRCGLSAAPAGAAPGPSGMIAHDDTAETYIVISGSGTLVTGGTIVNGSRSAPDSDVTRILNGPSCSGAVVGDTVSRKMGVGDISVIPAGTPHGWIGITTEVTYLSVRPDPKKVLAHGYVNPEIK